MRTLRTWSIGKETFYSLQAIAGETDALVLEIGNPTNLVHYWPLCSQLLALTPRKFLIKSEGEADVWARTMDMAVARDSDDAIASLRYKPSVRNGRVFAARRDSCSARCCKAGWHSGGYFGRLLGSSGRGG